MKNIILLVAIIPALILLITGCPTPTSTPTSTTTAPQIGKMAPDFQLPQLEGQTVSLRDFRGQPVLLNFWATWCGPCRYEMPFIQKVYDERNDYSPPLVVLAINSGEAPSLARDFIESNDYSFPVLLDTSQEVFIAYNLRYFPTTFFIDGNGIIEVIKVGAFSGVAEIEANLSKITP
jgi:peroxiredoxin